VREAKESKDQSDQKNGNDLRLWSFVYFFGCVKAFSYTRSYSYSYFSQIQKPFFFSMTLFCQLELGPSQSWTIAKLKGL